MRALGVPCLRLSGAGSVGWCDYFALLLGTRPGPLFNIKFHKRGTITHHYKLSETGGGWRWQGCSPPFRQIHLSGADTFSRGK